VLARRFETGALQVRLGRFLGEEEARCLRGQLGVFEALAEAAETT
jgi:hypothetical protein